MEAVSDDDLVRLYRNGEAAAFDTLFDRYHVGVYSFARTMLGDSGGPEDVLQETFLTVAQSLAKYTPQGKFRSWLMRIARNRCLARLEARRITKLVLAAGNMEPSEPASLAPGPQQAAQDDEQVQIIRAAIDALPDRQREALALYAFEQMTYQEIAETLAAPINTVKTLIRRGRSAVARKLESQRGERT